MDNVLQLAAAFSGSMGFALLFQVRRGKLLLASLGGLLAWAVYLALGPVISSDVPRFFIASVVLTIYGEILARVVKCPATLFLVTAAVPLIPGGSLYHTMRYFVEGGLCRLLRPGTQHSAAGAGHCCGHDRAHLPVPADTPDTGMAGQEKVSCAPGPEGAGRLCFLPKNGLVLRDGFPSGVVVFFCRICYAGAGVITNGATQRRDRNDSHFDRGG